MKKYTVLISALIVLVILGAGYFLISKIEITKEPKLKSVMPGGEYHSTSTVSRDTQLGIVYAGRTEVLIVSTTPFDMVPFAVTNSEQRYGSITLGSVIIASSSKGYFRIHDATSTTDFASTTVIAFDNNEPETDMANSYALDIIMKRGIVLDFGTGFNGAYTITWRE